MGQAKRRSKKKSEFKLPSFSFNQESLRAGTERWQAKLAPLTAKWQLLPMLHRRALMVLIPAVVLLLIWPAGDSSLPQQTEEPQRHELELSLDERQASNLPVDQRAEPLSPQRPVAARAEPASPVRETQPATVAQWQKYQVQKGETLANIFRDKSLPLSDLYAVAAIEGKDKPLSRIQPGQWLRYKQTANGDLDVLQIESRDGESAMFFRRSDGSFVRSQ